MTTIITDPIAIAGRIICDTTTITVITIAIAPALLTCAGTRTVL